MVKGKKKTGKKYSYKGRTKSSHDIKLDRATGNILKKGYYGGGNTQKKGASIKKKLQKKGYHFVGKDYAIPKSKVIPKKSKGTKVGPLKGKFKKGIKMSVAKYKELKHKIMLEERKSFAEEYNASLGESPRQRAKHKENIKAKVDKDYKNNPWRRNIARDKELVIKKGSHSGRESYKSKQRRQEDKEIYKRVQAVRGPKIARAIKSAKDQIMGGLINPKWRDDWVRSDGKSKGKSLGGRVKKRILKVGKKRKGTKRKRAPKRKGISVNKRFPEGHVGSGSTQKKNRPKYSEKGRTKNKKDPLRDAFKERFDLKAEPETFWGNAFSWKSERQPKKYTSLEKGSTWYKEAGKIFAKANWRPLYRLKQAGRLPKLKGGSNGKSKRGEKTVARRKKKYNVHERSKNKKKGKGRLLKFMSKPSSVMKGGWSESKVKDKKKIPKLFGPVQRKRGKYEKLTDGWYGSDPIKSRGEKSGFKSAFDPAPHKSRKVEPFKGVMKVIGKTAEKVKDVVVGDDDDRDVIYRSKTRSAEAGDELRLKNWGKDMSASYKDKMTGEKLFAESEQIKKSTKRVRSLGLNYKIIGLIVIVAIAIIGYFFLGKVIKTVILALVVLMVAVFIIRAVRGKTRYGIRGWSALGIIGIISLSFFVGNLRMAVPLYPTDVTAGVVGLDLHLNDFEGTTTSTHYIDKFVDASNVITTGAGGSPYDMFIGLSGIERSSETNWKLDMDGEHSGMPEMQIIRGASTIACDAKGTETNGQFIDDMLKLPQYDVKLFVTYFKTTFSLIFTASKDFDTISKLLGHKLINYQCDGEFDMDFYGRSLDINTDIIMYDDVNGAGMSGEIAIYFSARPFLIDKDTDDDLSDDAEYVSSAVLSVDVVETLDSWKTTYCDPDGDTEVDGKHITATGNYDVLVGGYDLLLYRSIADALNEHDSFYGGLTEGTFASDWYNTVYVPINFDVAMGAECGGSATFATNLRDVTYISEYRCDIELVVSVASEYRLMLLADGTQQENEDTDGDNDPDDPNTFQNFFLDLFGTFYGFWKQSFFGKLVVIGTPIVVVLLIVWIRARVKYNPNRKKKGGTQEQSGGSSGSRSSGGTTVNINMNSKSSGGKTSSYKKPYTKR